MRPIQSGKVLPRGLREVISERSGALWQRTAEGAWLPPLRDFSRKKEREKFHWGKAKGEIKKEMGHLELCLLIPDPNHQAIFICFLSPSFAWGPDQRHRFLLRLVQLRLQGLSLAGVTSKNLGGPQQRGLWLHPSVPFAKVGYAFSFPNPAFLYLSVWVTCSFKKA